MKRLPQVIIALFILAILSGCTNPVKAEHPRLLVLNGKTIELPASHYKSWKCSNVVEVGYFLNYSSLGDISIEDMSHEEIRVGFVLYDGKDKGEITVYHRDGLDKRWDWGEKPNNYAFLLDPEGTGLFYKFSTAVDGFKEKADHLVYCSEYR